MIESVLRQLLFAVLIVTVAPAGAQAPPPLPAAPAEPSRPLFLFLYRPGPAWVAGRPMREQNMRPHGLYMAQLLREGRLAIGGGFVGEDGGMAVVRAADADEARAMLAADPAIASGLFVAELRRWRPRFHDGHPLVEAAPGD